MNSSGSFIKSYFNLFQIRKIYLIVYILILLNSCKQDEASTIDLCLQNLKIEAIRPSTYSLDWIPYSKNQELVFADSSGKTIKLICTVNDSISESLQSFFYIVCPSDSSKQKHVNYTSYKYQYIFEVENADGILNSIQINLDVILDEIHSQLSKALLADIMQVEFTIKKPGESLSSTLRFLQFPVLNRGYTDALFGDYQFIPLAQLNHREFTELYTNLENGYNISVYYSQKGLEGFVLDGDLYLRIQ